MCTAQPESRFERNAQGELIEMAPAGSETGHRNFELAGQLWAWNRQSRLIIPLNFCYPMGQ